MCCHAHCNRCYGNIVIMDSEEETVRGKITRTYGEITFNSKFDSGNLDRVEQCPFESPDITSFNLWTSPDCAGTCYENSNKSWFYFSVTYQPSQENERTRTWPLTIRMNIMNLNKQMRLYQQGLTPMIKTLPGRGGWERLRGRPVYQMGEEGMILTFEYTPFELGRRHKSVTYFAFCYPYSYNECQKYLNKIDKQLLCQQQDSNIMDESIYYHRQLLCNSLDDLRIDLLTISSYHGITMETEPHLPGLYPDVSEERARVFENKKVVFITSRVHPGETPSSFVFNGFLEFILNQNDPRSKILRQNFVFKMVPMLNPDGVQRGHYRTDSRGINLNRVYIDPKWELHPSIFCVRSLIMYHHLGVVLHHHSNTSDHDSDPPTCDCASLHVINKESSTDNRESSKATIGTVAVYVDLHAHATKRGCFMYGNHFATAEQHVDCMLFPKLVSLNSVHFDFSHCLFSEKNMSAPDRGDYVGKEGSGRVAIYKATGLIQSYTLECNYNSGARTNGLYPAVMDGGRATPPSTASAIPYKYISSNYTEVGHGLAIAILDLYQINPWSRIPSSNYSSLNGIRQSLLQTVQECRLKQNGNKSNKVYSKHMMTNSNIKEDTYTTTSVNKASIGLMTEPSNENQTVIINDSEQRDDCIPTTTKTIFRRHTSPSLVFPHHSHIYDNHNHPIFLSSNNLHRGRLNVNNISSSRSIQLPIVRTMRPILNQNLFHAIRKQTTPRDISINGPNYSVNLLNRFAIIGHRVTSSGTSPISDTTVTDLPQQRNTIVKRTPKKSLPNKFRQKKLTARPTTLFSSTKMRSSYHSPPPVINTSPSHRPAVIQLATTIRKK